MVRQASAASRAIQETYVASCSAEMSFGSAGTGEIYTYERLRCGEANGRDTPDFKPMQTHSSVIENFIREGKGGKGTYLRATDDVLLSKIPDVYRPYGHSTWGRNAAGQTTELAVRLKDGSILTNGARFDTPIDEHQRNLISALEESDSRFSVVPFHSITAAWTDGEIDDWSDAPFDISDLQKEVSVVIPSGGEEWKYVKVKDKNGRITERQIHTLGDSVLRVKDRFYLSGVDETGKGAGMYFFAELATKQAPPTLEEAYNMLKPKVVREAEGRELNVLRQGEWFAIPAQVRTSELMRDVERGIAAYRQRHVLGKDGHHELEEAVLYKAGERKGQVYARGVLRHTQDEHGDLDLGTVRWYLIVHNVVGASYTLSGKGTAQFD